MSSSAAAGLRAAELQLGNRSLHSTHDQAGAQGSQPPVDAVAAVVKPACSPCSAVAGQYCSAAEIKGAWISLRVGCEKMSRMVKIEQTISIRPPKMDMAAGRRTEEEMDPANASSA